MRKRKDGQEPVTETYKLTCEADEQTIRILEQAQEQARNIAKETIPYLAAQIFAKRIGYMLVPKNGAGAGVEKNEVEKQLFAEASLNGQSDKTKKIVQNLKDLAPLLNSDTRDAIKSKIRALLTGENMKKLLNGQRRIPQAKEILLRMRPTKIYGEKNRSVKRGISIVKNGDGEYYAVLDILSDGDPLRLKIETQGLENDQAGKNGYALKVLRALGEVSQNPDPLGDCELRIIKEKEGKKKVQLLLAYTKYVSKHPRRDDAELIVGVDIGKDFRAAVFFSDGEPDHYWINELAIPFKSMRKYREVEYKIRQLLSSQPWRGGHGERERFEPFEVIRCRMRDKEREFARLFVAELCKMIEHRANGRKVLIRIEDLRGLGGGHIGTDKFPYHLIYSLLEHKAAHKSWRLEEVKGHYMSMTCSQCRAVNFEFTWGYRKENGFPSFSCPQCGYTDDADLNAARNLASRDFAALEAEIERQCKEHQKREKELEAAIS